MIDPRHAIGVDVGASGTRIALLADGERRDRVHRTPLPRLNGHVDLEALAGHLTRSITSAVADGDHVDVVAIGMAGFPDLVESPATLAGLLMKDLGTRKIILAGDAYTSHVGALDYRTGTVVAAGTGVIALGTDHESSWTRADGWGVLLGDEGGGAWIGRAGLSAAMKAADGRAGGSAELLNELEARFGAAEHLVRDLYASPNPSTFLGGFAPAVAEVARSGDPVAIEIWRQAGAHLAVSAASAASEVGPVVSWAGGIFAARDLILPAFESALRELLPQVQLEEPIATSAEGALHLAQADGVRSHPPFVEVFVGD